MASLDVLLVMALKEESQGLFEADGIKPFYCGLGQVKATYHLTQWVKEYKPKHVINLGTVGSHRFSQGELVECTSFIQRVPHEHLQIKSKVIKAEPITKLPQVICGTGDFVEKASPITPCDVFDMEAFALAYVCQQQNVKFNSIKAVSDRSDENIIHDWQKSLHMNAQLLLQSYREMTTMTTG